MAETNAAGFGSIKWEELVLAEEIGRGDSGIVHRGKYKGRDVAIKTPKRPLATDAERQQFFMGAHVVRKLPRNPRLLEIIGICDAANEPPAIVAELVEGEKLNKVLGTVGSNLSLVRLVLRCARDIAHALSIMHAHGIVHRDVALRNVMLTKELVCKLLDYGQAESGDEHLRFSSHANERLPLRWIPPETFSFIIEGGRVHVPFSTKTDTWAFGVLIWEMFTLGVPYSAIPYADQLRAIRQAVCVDGVKLSKPLNCPVAIFDRVMSKCFNTNPNDRPTMTEIKSELQSLMRELEGGSELGGLGNGNGAPSSTPTTTSGGGGGEAEVEEEISYMTL